MNDQDDGWLNGGMPFIDHVFDGKTGREIARENLKKWAAERQDKPNPGADAHAPETLPQMPDLQG